MLEEKAGGNAGGVRIGVGLGTDVTDGIGVTERMGVGDAVAVGADDGSADGGVAQPVRRHARIRTRLSRDVNRTEGRGVCLRSCMGQSYRGRPRKGFETGWGPTGVQEKPPAGSCREA
jgi:hypothetical protein